jgi:hypothetical protein
MQQEQEQDQDYRVIGTSTELVINVQTGEVFTTVEGYCEMSGADQTAVCTRFSNIFAWAKGSQVKIAAVQTREGRQEKKWIIPADVAFEWALDDNPELARKMIKSSTTAYLQRLAGINCEPTVSTGQLHALRQANEEADIIGVVLAKAGISPSLISLVKLEHLKHQLPHLTRIINQASEILAISDNAIAD